MMCARVCVPLFFYTEQEYHQQQQPDAEKKSVNVFFFNEKTRNEDLPPMDTLDIDSTC